MTILIRMVGGGAAVAMLAIAAAGIYAELRHAPDQS
jgi:hypothetical protein